MTNEELVARIQGGDQECMGVLWQQVERLFAWKANRILNALDGSGGVEFDDLYNTGYLAIVTAVETYQAGEGAFSSWIMFHLKTAFAEATGYRTVTQQKDPIRHAVSLSTPLSDDAGAGELGDIVADPAGEVQMESLEHQIYRQQLHEALKEAVEALPDNLKTVIRQRYYEDSTLQKVADSIGKSPARVRNMETQALQRLRGGHTVSRLISFVDFDFYGGTGLGAFRRSGMSVEEWYLIKQERLRKLEQKRRERMIQEQVRREIDLILNGDTCG